MSNTNRDYAIIYDVKNSLLIMNRPLIFYLTDKNTSNIFVRLVININVGDGIDQYTDLEPASNYVLTMKVIKPNNEVKSIEATQHEEGSIFQFDLTEDFKDIPGKYICELTISTIVSGRQELTTSNPFSYEVKRSILSNVGEIIETEDTTVEKLLNDLDATKSKLFNDLELAKTNLHNDLESAKTELGSQIKDIANYIEQKSNGVDDTDLIQLLYDTCKTTSKQIFIPHGTSYIISGLNIGVEGFKIWGGGTLIHKNNSNTPLLTISASKFNIDGIELIGTSTENDINSNNDIGLAFIGDGATEGKDRHLISNCRFQNFQKSGIYNKNLYNTNSTVQVSNCNFYGNKVGYYSDSYGEYATFTNCNFIKNTNGVWLYGGNNNFIGCTLDQNVNAIMMYKGVNDGHGIFSACNINHNTQYGVYVEELNTGYTFDSCHIFESPIGVMRNRAGFPIVFDNCMLDPVSIIGEWADVCFYNNRFINSYLNDVNNINFKFNGHESIVLAENNIFGNPNLFKNPFTLNGTFHKYKLNNNQIITSASLVNFDNKVVNMTPFISESGTLYINETTINKLTRNTKKVNINALIKFTLNENMNYSNTLIKLCDGVENSKLLLDFNITRYNDILYFATINCQIDVEVGKSLSVKVFPPTGKTLTILADESFIEVSNL